MDPKLEEALNLLQEECAEVIQIISKIRRFGLNESYNNKTNVERLTEELTDVQILVNYVNDFVDTYDTEYADSKYQKLTKYTNLFNSSDEEHIFNIGINLL